MLGGDWRGLTVNIGYWQTQSATTIESGWPIQQNKAEPDREKHVYLENTRLDRPTIFYLEEDTILPITFYSVKVSVAFYW